jgi:nucleotide-binding universal stress UspA family protein
MRVLVPIDKSNVGESALQAISSWVQDSGATVTLFRVVHPRDVRETARPARFSHSLTPVGVIAGHDVHVADPYTQLAENRSQMFTRLREEQSQELRALVDRYFPSGEHSTVVHVSEDIPSAIVLTAKEVNADVIAMGTHGRGAVGKALLGSVAEHVIRESTIPVLLVGPRVS